MRSYILALVLLSAAFTAAALPQEELRAVEAIFRSFPALQLASPAWSANASLACVPPAFYGLTCLYEPEQRIVGMYVRIESTSKQVGLFLSLLRSYDTDSPLNLLSRVSQFRNFTLPQLSGSIPAEIGDLKNLESLYAFNELLLPQCLLIPIQD